MSEIKHWIRENCGPDIQVREMPDIRVIMQLLKLSETDKQQAIENLTNLFRHFRGEEEITGIDSQFMSPDMCKQFVEDYLKNPFVAEKDLEES